MLNIYIYIYIYIFNKHENMFGNTLFDKIMGLVHVEIRAGAFMLTEMDTLNYNFY